MPEKQGNPKNSGSVWFNNKKQCCSRAWTWREIAQHAAAAAAAFIVSVSAFIKTHVQQYRFIITNKKQQ